MRVRPKILSKFDFAVLFQTSLCNYITVFFSPVDRRSPVTGSRYNNMATHVFEFAISKKKKNSIIISVLRRTFDVCSWRIGWRFTRTQNVLNISKKKKIKIKLFLLEILLCYNIIAGLPRGY